jgi:pSer/pThr/pTyr-binding forkhead associated (FHA) protein
LDSGVDSRSVSRLHALIQRRDAGDYYLIDLGSRNGSFVNRRRVSLPLRLQDQDRLVFAEQELLEPRRDQHATYGRNEYAKSPHGISS